MKLGYGFVEWNDNYYPSPVAAFGHQQLGKWTAPIVCVDPPKADADLSNKMELRGNIALVERGKCPFPDKAKRVQAAGAIAMIVANDNTEGSKEAFTMGEMEPGEADEVQIPCVMLSHENTCSLMNYAHEALNAVVKMTIMASDDAARVYQQYRERKNLSDPVDKNDGMWDQLVNSSSTLLKLIEETKRNTGVMADSSEKEIEVVQWLTIPLRFAFVRWNTASTEFKLQYVPLAEFGPEIESASNFEVFTGKLVYADPILADKELQNADRIKGNIAIVRRGGCTFPEKLTRVQEAGAVAAVVENTDQDDKDNAFVMSANQLCSGHFSIPSVMVSHNIANELRECHPTSFSIVCASSDTASLLFGDQTDTYSLSTPPPSLPYVHGKNALFSACREAEVEIVEELLLRDTSARSTNDGWGLTPLHSACISGSENIVELLLRTGHEDVNAIDMGNRTALHFACSSGHVKCAEALIGANADVAVRTIGGRTALHYAALAGSTGCIEMLLSANALLDANGNYLFNNINDKDAEMSTPLHYACKTGHMECAMYLIAANASMDDVDDSGSTAMHYACMHVDSPTRSRDASQVVERMLKEGASAIPDRKGLLPVDLINTLPLKAQLETKYLRASVWKHQGYIKDLKEQEEGLEKCVAEYVSEHITNQFKLREAEKERESMQVDLQNQRVKIQQMQSQIQTLLQYLQKPENQNLGPTIPATTLLRSMQLPSSELSIGNNEDFNSESELAEEAGFAREVGKKHARNRDYRAAIGCFQKSLDLYPLPGVQRLLDKVNEKQRQVEIQREKEEIERRRGESKESLMERYRSMLNSSGAPASAIEAIDEEISKLSSLIEGSPEFSLAREWLNWLVVLPWDQPELCFGLDLFKRVHEAELEEHQRLQNRAASVIQRAVREYMSAYFLERDIAASQIQHLVKRFLRRNQSAVLPSVSEDGSSVSSITETASEEDNQLEDVNQQQTVEPRLEDEDIALNENPQREMDPLEYNSKADTFIPTRIRHHSKVRVGIKLIQPPLLLAGVDDPKEKFHILQLLECCSSEGSTYYVWNRWGITGISGQSALKGPYDEEGAMREYARKYCNKTANSPTVSKEDFVATPGSFLPAAWPNSSSKLCFSSEVPEGLPVDDPCTHISNRYREK